MTITKNLKYLDLHYSSEKRILIISGDNKYVKGEIIISGRYLYSLFVFIARIFRIRRTK
jgi:hypothetical protein